MHYPTPSTLALLGILVLLTACAGPRTTVPFHQADAEKIRESARVVVISHDLAVAEACHEPREVQDIEPVSAFPDGKPQEERWTLLRCGRASVWRVRYHPKPNGSFGIQTTPER